MVDDGKQRFNVVVNDVYIQWFMDIQLNNTNDISRFWDRGPWGPWGRFQTAEKRSCFGEISTLNWLCQRTGPQLLAKLVHTTGVTTGCGIQPVMLIPVYKVKFLWT